MMLGMVFAQHHVVLYRFRVLCVGALAVPDHSQNLVLMPPIKVVKLDADGLQHHCKQGDAASRAEEDH